MIRSTLGFIFTPDFKNVLLITKHKPESHNGKLNGIGGKCEGDESDLMCIVRETQEETNLVIPQAEWQQFATLKWTQWQVTVFVTQYQGSPTDVKSLTDDPVAWYQVSKLPNNVISNLNWLIPLSIDVEKNEIQLSIAINYAS